MGHFTSVSAAIFQGAGFCVSCSKTVHPQGSGAAAVIEDHGQEGEGGREGKRSLKQKTQLLCVLPQLGELDQAVSPLGAAGFPGCAIPFSLAVQ